MLPKDSYTIEPMRAEVSPEMQQHRLAAVASTDQLKSRRMAGSSRAMIIDQAAPGDNRPALQQSAL